MSIAEFSVRRPVFMTIIYALLVIISIVYIPKLDQEIFPSVDLPYLIVYASCSEADPESVEMQVTRPLENAVSGVENLKKITSYSQTGTSILMLEFNYGTDTDDSESDVSSYTAAVTRNLPSWVTSVNTMQVSSLMSSQAFMTLSVDGPYPLDELKNIANNTVEPLLTRIDGVGDVNISGGGDVEYHVEADPNRLSAYGISLAQVVSAVSAANNMGTGGQITTGDTDYNVMTDNRYTSIEDMLNTRVATIGGKNIYIGDIANVIKTTEKGATTSYINGNPTVTIRLYEASDASVSSVAKRVKANLASIQAALPNDVTLTIRRDNSKNITAVINETYSSLGYGVLFAALVIFIFLVDFKATIIISLSMPLCVLFTLMLMSITGVTINMMSMSGLILGIGMIVDASVIILENITRYRLEGETAPAAAILGSKNMFTSIVASTLTTICVFLPMIIYMNDLEMIGQMMRDLVFTVCFSLICSLFVSVTLVPALAGAILPINTTTQRKHRGWLGKFDNLVKRCMAAMENGYAKLLGFFLAYKRFLLVPLLAMFILSISLISHLGFTMMPSNASGDSITLSLKLPNGTTADVTKDYVFRMQETVEKKFPEGSYNSIIARIDDNEGSLEIMLPDISKQKYSALTLRNMVREDLVQDANAMWTYSSGQRMGNNSAVDIEITADDMDEMNALSSEIVQALKDHSEILTNIESETTGGAPRINVKVDKARADAFGITASTISSLLSTAISGTRATELSTFSSSETYYLRVMLANEYTNDIQSLNALLIPSNYGNVRLDSIATLEEDTSPTRITRENKKRVNHITADVLEGHSSSEASNLAQSIIDEYISIPQGIRVEMSGDTAEFAKYTPILIGVLVLALALVFGVMAAQFESLINPFIIFATIPLLMIGVTAIHFITRSDISVMSIFGIVALIGVVVNNGIVLIDAITREIKDYGTGLEEACLKCAKDRLRAILMTTITTVVGLIPMAFFPGEGAKQMQPIALTFFGGIITGSFITLFLSPVLFAIFNKRFKRRLDNPNSRENQLKAFDGRLATK